MKNRDHTATEKFDVLVRITDGVMWWIGSIPSLIAHSLVFIVAFVLPAFGLVAFDKMLLVLTTVLSLEAIYLAIFIQMSVNRSQEHIEDLKDDVNEIQEDIEDIQEDIEEISEDIEEISEDIDDIQEDLEDIAEEDDEMDGAAAHGVRNPISSRENENALLRAKIVELEKMIERLKKNE